MKKQNGRKSKMTLTAILCALMAVFAAGCGENGQLETTASTSSTNALSPESTAEPEPSTDETDVPAAASASPVTTSNIDLAEAKRVVLDHAGLTETQVTFVKVKLENDDGVAEYDIEFLANSQKYEYEISAEDGDLLEFSVEAISPTTTVAEAVPTTTTAAETPQSSATVTTVPQTTTTVTTSQTTAAATTVSSPQASDITEAEAKSAALKHAGLKESQVTFTKSKLDYDDGVSRYEIEFVTDSMKYEYEVRASDGKILESSTEVISVPSQQAQQTAGSITEAEAKSAALKHAGLKESQVTFTKSKLDYDDGISHYEIEFVTDSMKYEYEVRASDGKILESSTEAISTPSRQTSGMISEAEAKKIALDSAGFTSNQVKFTKAKLDYDDGIAEYEIEFRVNGLEYEFTINASTGEIIESEIDD